MIEISGISKSSYFKWKNNASKREKRREQDKLIIAEIKAIYDENKGTYGVERMTQELQRRKKYCNHKKVYRLMKENGYLSVIKKKKKYTKPGKSHPKLNVLKRNFRASCPYDKMATDTSEIKMFGKKIYLSPIKDLCTNALESCEIGPSANLVMVLNMFNKINDKAIPEGTILHSDQGALYNNLRYQEQLKKCNFIQSMSRKGTPIDNSPMESFFGTLKSELIYNPLIKFESYDDLVCKIKEYIDYYNTKRIQKKLGYLTPFEFKEKCLEQTH